MSEAVSRQAKTLVYDDEDRVCLQIELGNQQAVTLTCWKNGDPPDVALWHGNAEHSFIRTPHERGENADSFSAWLDQLGPVAE